MTRLALFSSTALALLAGPALAQDACEDLWLERNGIYKEAGYCFKTRRAVSRFGNAGCQYDDIRDVPLSANARARVAAIARAERAAGCRE